MTLIIALVIGFAAGCFVNYAVTFRSGQGRNIGVCVVGALIGGALIPALLSMSGFWPAVIGSVAGILILGYLWVKLSPVSSSV
ncbi:MAG: hypothetical protein KDK10_13765 [Maritimibacter sp.]|nr:hypothetical protein [Maritimibacter sp.]MCB2111586.1 hypothetical protein [Paracoccaceae bacterium]